MPDLTRPGALPLRPLTTGELLDSAVALVGARPGRLVGLGVGLAIIEQVLLFPLRRLADQDLSLMPGTGRLAEFGLLVVAGFGLEALIITILGGVAAREGTRAVLGNSAPPPPPRRPVTVAVLALVAFVVVAASAFGFVTVLEPLQSDGFLAAAAVTACVWPLPYGLIGLAAPAAVIERRGPLGALGRSMRLTSRNSLRGVSLRVLGALSWMAIRAALFLATVGLLELVIPTPDTWADGIVLAVAAVSVNAVAYPMLGCLDVVLLLEIRMRTEGLDIALRRSLRRGVDTAPALEVPR